jgi:hypothetical protein
MSELLSENQLTGFDSKDCFFIIADGPGDTTVRPSEGKVREAGLREQERIARWEQQRRENPGVVNPPDAPRQPS